MEREIKQIDNIQSFEIIFEPVHSPEYNQYCKDERYALVYVGGKYTMFENPDGSRVTLVHHPLFDGKTQEPYRITSANETYKDPREARKAHWKKEIEEGRLRLLTPDDCFKLQPMEDKETEKQLLKSLFGYDSNEK